MNARNSKFARSLAAALLALLALGLAPGARAASGSYATAGTGTYAASLWWLDFSSYVNATAAGGGQGFSFTLPNGLGTFSTTVTMSGNGAFAAAASPAWTGGGALGHGAYNGITGKPSLYWLAQAGASATVSLSNFTLVDGAGNPRSFALYAADGENTNAGESIVYTSTAPWKLVDTVNYFASFTGGLVNVAGANTTVVTETAPSSKDGNYNDSIVLGTASPTSVSAKMTNNEAVLFAIALPTVQLTLNVGGRVVAADQFTTSISYTSPAALIKAATTSGTGTTATTGSTAVIGTNSLTLSVAMAAGSSSPLSYYASSVSCTNSGPGAASFTGANTVLPTGSGSSFTVTPQSGDNISCTLSLAPVTQTLTGTVYADLNHDSALDNGETGTGIAGLYVKLANSVAGVCQSPATIAAPVTAATGAYSVAGVAPGSYCLTLTNSASLAATTPYLPPGYIGTEAASGVRTLTVSASPAPVQNFGLYSGSTLALTVFADTGASGGTANDGVQNGAEPGLANVALTASAGGSPVATATTAANGVALLWLPASAVGSTISVVPGAPVGYLPTGGTVGTTGGAYARPALSFTLGAGAAYTGAGFGLIPASSLAPNGVQSIQPAGTVYFPHTYLAGSAGSLGFATSATSSPTLAGWNELVYLDPTCSGQYVTGDPQVLAPIAVAAGQTVCVLVREFAPATAPTGATNKVTLTATLTYSGAAAPAAAVLTASDTSTVTNSGNVQLSKQVQNVTQGGSYGTSDTAQPGNTLQYRVTVTNVGPGAATQVVIDDATPAYTSFVAANCPVVLPAGLTTCTVSAAPAPGGTGAVQWTFTGSLASGAQASVTFQVQLNP